MVRQDVDIKAVIFDLDGVICHTDKYHYRAWKQIADELGAYFDEKINNRLRGVSRMASLEIILERYDGELSDEEKVALAEKKNKAYQQLLKYMTPSDVAPEVLETLRKLRARKIKIAIGSSSRNARLILNQIGLMDWFDAISDGNNITHSKPDPEVFVKAGEMLGMDPSNCIVVEDAEAGIEAAKRGGMVAVLIGNSASDERAGYHIQRLDELLTLFEF
jgi:beta-phosphoglucomutase